MKLLQKLLITIILTVIILGCSNKQNGENKSVTNQSEKSSGSQSESVVMEEMTLSDLESPVSASDKNKLQEGQNIDFSKIISSVSVTGENTLNRMIIRTADVKFRTKNVPEATYEIERIVAINGGWVANTNLYSEELSENRLKVSRDSTLVISKFVIRNSMTIRAPYTSMDTILRSLVPMIEHLDYRIINAEDVTLSILSEKLRQKRLSEYNSRMKKYTDAGASKLKDLTEAEQQILSQQLQADASLIEEMKLNDDILNCTIKLDIYETEKFEKFLVPNPDEIQKYKPGFGKRFVQSIKTGWIIIQEILIGITNLWGIIVVGIGLYLLIRFLVKRFSKNKKNKL
jgi:hypothetical protein